MFKDTKKELERLEAELLAEQEEPEEVEEYEEWEEDLLDDDDDFGVEEVHRNFRSHYRAYNTDRTDWDPEELGEELDRKPKTGIWWLCALVLALTAGIFAVLAWWVMRFKGGIL